MKNFKPIYLTLVIVSLVILNLQNIFAQSKDLIDYTKFRIKFHESLSEYLHLLPEFINGSYDTCALTGIESVDQLNIKYNIPSIKKIFPYDAKFSARHKKYGLNLWYEFYLSDETWEQVSAIVEEFNDDVNITIAEHVYTATTGSTLDSIPDDPRFSDQWHYHNVGQSAGKIDADIDLPEAWALEAGDTSVIVAIIDGGIDIYHDDLKDALWVNRLETNGIPGIDDDNNGYIDDIHGYNFVENNSIIPINNHGTHVAGTVGAVNNNNTGVSGVAGGSGSGNGVRLMSCGVFNAQNGGGNFPEAFIYAADNGAVIAQNSWSYRFTGYFPQVMKDAIDYFIDNAGYDEHGDPFGPMQGGIVIFAAGNKNLDGLNYPAYYERVIAVASVDHKDKKSSFSNYGHWIDIAAPGTAIHSTWTNNSYNTINGTSMACPHVSGVAALIISKHGRLGFTPEILKENLLNSTDNINNDNPDYTDLLGTGRLNAFKALLLNDTISFDPITDLSIEETGQTSVKLKWTSTLHGISDNVFGFNDIRYSENPIHDGNFDSTLSFFSHDTPASFGNPDSVIVTGLTPGTLYYFAIKVTAFNNNQSSISNLVSANLLPAPRITISKSSLYQQLDSGLTGYDQFEISNPGDEDLIFNIRSNAHNRPIQSNNEEIQLTKPIFSIDETNKLILSINPATNEILDTLFEGLPINGSDHGLTFDGEFIYYRKNLSSDTSIYKIDIGINSVMDTFHFDSKHKLSGLAHSGEYIYATDMINNQIIIIDFENKKIIDTILINKNIGDAISYGGSRGTLFVSSNDSKFIYEINIINSTIVKTLTSPGNITGLAYSEGDNLLYTGSRILSVARIDALDPNDGSIIFSRFTDHVSALAADEFFTTPWITLIPGIDTLQAGENVNISVGFHTDSLIPNIYKRDIVIESNAPLHPVSIIPTTLYVPGEPVINTVDTVYFEPAFMNFTHDSISLLLSNTGTDTLVINDINLTSSDFSIENTSFPFMIPRKSNKTIYIYFTPVTEGLKNDTVTITSNSVTNSSKEIIITGESLIAPEMSVSPDSISTEIASSDSLLLQIQVGNILGGSILNFTIDTRVEEIVNTFRSGTLLNARVLFTNNFKHKYQEELTNQGAIISIHENIIDSSVLKNTDILIIDDVTQPKSEEIDVIRNWITNGGNLIIDADQDRERFNSLLLNTGIEYIDQRAEVGYAIDLAKHPVTYDLEKYFISNLGGFSILKVSGDAISLLKDTKGFTHIAASKLGKGKIMAVANEGVGSSSLYPITGHVELMNNAIGWMMKKDWMNIATESGSISQGDQQVIDILYNTRDIKPGNYETNILVNSNDPLNPFAVINTQLIVYKNNASISLSDSTIIFDTIPIAEINHKPIIIANESRETLVVDSIYTTNQSFSIGQSNIHINPESRDTLNLYFSPDTVDLNSAVVYFLSNDLEKPIVSANLEGVGLGGPHMKLSDIFFDFNIIPIRTVKKDSLVITNIGIEELIIDSIYTLSGKYTVSVNDTSIGSKQLIIIYIQYSSDQIGTHMDTLTIISNDFNDTIKLIPLQGKASEELIDVETGLLSVNVFQGDTLSNELIIKNTAEETVLTFDIYVNNLQQEILGIHLDSMEHGNLNGVRVLFTNNEFTELQDTLEQLGAITHVVTSQLDSQILDTIDILVLGQNTLYNSSIECINSWIKNGGNLITDTDNNSTQLRLLYTGTGLDPRLIKAETGLTSDISEHASTIGINEYFIEEEAGLSFWLTEKEKPLIKGTKGNNYAAVTYYGLGKIIAIGGHSLQNASINQTGHLTFGLNALKWMNNKIKLVTPSNYSGTINPGNSLPIDILFDSRKVPLGIYTGDIVISSNDSLNPTIILPFLMEVSDGASIKLSADTLNFLMEQTGVAEIKALNINNPGNKTLQIDTIYIDKNDFEVSFTKKSIEPDATDTLQISYVAQTTMKDSAILVIQSNAFNKETIQIPIIIEFKEPKISIHEKSYEISLFIGDTLTKPLTISNLEGAKKLTVDLEIEFIEQYPGNDSVDLSGSTILFIDSTRTSFKSELDARGATTIINSGEITDSSLIDVDVFIFYGSNSLTNQEKDIINNWINQGGNIIIDGGYFRSTYNSITHTSGIYFMNKRMDAQLITNLIDHEITSGISEYYIPTTLTVLTLSSSDANALITDSINDINAAITTKGTGKILAMASESVSNININQTGHLELMLNALQWMNVSNIQSPEWITISTNTDTIPAEQSRIIDITFDAKELVSGTYESTIEVTSNDPSNPFISIPVELTILDGAFMELSKNEVELGLIALGDTANENITITNTGNQLLFIDSILSSNNNFKIDISGLSLQSKRDTNITVSYNSNEVQIDTGVLSFYSNDIFNSIKKIQVSAESRGAKISVSPDSFNLNINSGDTLQTELYISNFEGKRDLEFTIQIEGNTYNNNEINLTGTNILFINADRSSLQTELELNGAKTFIYSEEITEQVLDSTNIMVIYGSVSFTNAETNDINNWIENGGNMIIDGGYFRSTYNSFSVGAGISVINKKPVTGINSIIAEHEITSGLTSYEIGNSISVTQILNDKSTGLIYDQDSNCVAAIGIRVNGKVLAIASESASSSQINQAGHKLLLLNAIHWMINEESQEITWLATDVENGIVTVGNEKKILVKVNAINLPEGEYNAEINILSNDPSDSLITVPLILSVKDGGQASGFKENDYTAINKVKVYPNPFKENLIIEYNLQKRLKINISIYDLLGRNLGTIFHGYQDPGMNRYTWDRTIQEGKHAGKGAYIITIQNNNFRKSVMVNIF